MELEKQVRLLQLTYAGVLVDSLLQYAKEGVLEKITARKRAEQLAAGGMRAAQFEIKTPQEVFAKLSALFNCAQWQISEKEGGFIAEAPACMLCVMARKMGAPEPCSIYCLDPMEGMVKGLNPAVQFTVKETLWQGQKCRIEVESKNL